MPNNLVFNDVAAQLKTQIFGSDTSTAIKTDSSGNLSVTGNVTATITSSVPVTGTVTATITSSVPVTGTVTATITDTVPIDGTITGNVTATITSSVPVTGTVTATITSSVPVTGTVTATITSSVPVTGSVTQGAVAVTSANTAFSGIAAATGIALTIDTSQQQVYSFYVRNTGNVAVSVKLQIAPTDTDAYFMDDPSGEISITASTGKAVLVAQKYLNYTRLYYNAADTATFQVYYNSHI